MTKHITVSRGPLGGSEEVAAGWVERRAFDALFEEKERWREKAEYWRDGYEEVLGLLELRLAINECLGVMADLGGIVYDVAIVALADQATLARAQAKLLEAKVEIREYEMREAARGEELARKVVEAARMMGGGGALEAAIDVYDKMAREGK